MKVAIVALTRGGSATAQSLAQLLPGTGPDRVKGKTVRSVQVYLPETLKNSGNLPGIEYYSCTTPQLIQQIFAAYSGLIMIMATGIVVRAIAPVLQGKHLDPAVVVVDEKGQFAVSLLSGHLGGANDLARSAATVLEGTPVITTSTDVQGRLAVDVLAGDLGAKLEPLEYLKEVNSRIAGGEQVELLSEYPLALPSDHLLWQGDSWRVRVGSVENTPQLGGIRVVVTSKLLAEHALYLRPQCIAAGVGFRKGTPGPVILKGVKAALEQAGRSPLSLKKLVSIEAKAGEEGIHWAAQQLQVGVEFYPAETLAAILQTHVGLAHSQFVHKQMGVGGVCEPASLAGCRQGKIILGKQAGQGMTVALAEEEFGW